MLYKENNGSENLLLTEMALGVVCIAFVIFIRVKITRNCKNLDNKEKWSKKFGTLTQDLDIEYENTRFYYFWAILRRFLMCLLIIIPFGQI